MSRDESPPQWPTRDLAALAARTLRGAGPLLMPDDTEEQLQELKELVEKLTARVAALEARPVFVPYPYAVPGVQPAPIPSPYYQPVIVKDTTGRPPNFQMPVGQTLNGKTSFFVASNGDTVVRDNLTVGSPSDPVCS